MKYLIKESQSKILEKTIQDVIDSEVNSIKNDTEDFGLGEMDELEEINSIKKVVVDRIKSKKGIRVYVKLYVNSDRDEFFNFMSELNYRASMWFPNIFIQIDKIIGPKGQ